MLPGIRHSTVALMSPPTTWCQAETIAQSGKAQWKGPGITGQGLLFDPHLGRGHWQARVSELMFCRRGNRTTQLMGLPWRPIILTDATLQPLCAVPMAAAPLRPPWALCGCIAKLLGSSDYSSAKEECGTQRCPPVLQQPPMTLDNSTK